MQTEIFATDEYAAQAAAETIALEARNAVAERGRFVMAISGGRTPWIMYERWPPKMCRGTAYTSCRWMNE